MSTPIVGRVYKHFKGGVYRVMDNAVRNAATGEIGAYYENSRGTTHWRSLEEWSSPKFVHGIEIERFVLLPEESPEALLAQWRG